MPSYDARFIPNRCVSNSHIREHCAAHREQITTIGRNNGQQVRIERYTPDGLTLLDLALYTAIDVHDEDPDLVFVGYTDPESRRHDLRDRLGLSGIEPFTGKVKSEVPHPTLTDAEAADCSEFVERLTDDSRHQGLIAIAPHGGAIERHTDEQAERIHERLASKCVSVWVCKGFKKDGGAFDRWHITSTDISEESFPKLKTVIGRHFEYAVAFHGWSEDFICIGGRAPADLKDQIKTAITDAIPDPEIVVKTDEEGCPGALNGTSPKNIVNRLGTNGIHIEQSIDARRRFGRHIADAVAGVIGPKI
jgi:phage replication-related protein YjqB (UPF0714/DUF867 family)